MKPPPSRPHALFNTPSKMAAGTRTVAGCRLLVRPWGQTRSGSNHPPLRTNRQSFRDKDVLHMDNHVLLINKPAGVLSQSDRTGDVDVAALAREYVRVAARKTGEAFVAVVHRLDRPVSGVMCVARTSKAASRLSASFKKREGVEKIYHAVVAGKLSGSGVRRDLLLSPDGSGAVARHGRGPRTAIVLRGQGDDDDDAHHRLRAGSSPSSVAAAKPAELEWKVIGVSPSAAACLRCPHTGDPRTLVRVRLITGRKHQIRAQLAEMGHPVVGDTRYGKHYSSRQRQNRGGISTAMADADGRAMTLAPRLMEGAAEPLRDRSILLHASELAVPHPTRPGTVVWARAPPPEIWSELCGREFIHDVFGGDWAEDRAGLAQL